MCSSRTSKTLPTKNKKNQCGVAFVEAILCIPILIVFAYGVVDLGAWLMRHYTASRIVYEVSRAGANTVGLGEPNSATTRIPGCIVERAIFKSTDVACVSPTFKPFQHCIMHQRANTLLQAHGLSESGVILTTCYNESDGYVESRISIPFRSVSFGSFSDGSWAYDWHIWPAVRATARAPYLFN